jgi:hypothetical protein
MTITVKELYDATMKGEGIIAKHAKANPDMPVFVLIGQDNLAAGLVEKWALQASAMVPTCEGGPLSDKVNEARLIAEFMDKWPTKKQPD